MSNNSAKKTGKLIILSAPSGTGKSTVASTLLNRHSDKIVLSISATTRAPRGQEKEGVHYYFKSEEDFQKMIESKSFLEHAQVFGKHRYGTPLSFVEDVLRQGKSVLFDIDVQGARQIKKAKPAETIAIFLHPPTFQELESRLRNRKTETEDAIAQRLNAAKKEINESAWFDHQVTNSDLGDCIRQIEEILLKGGAL